MNWRIKGIIQRVLSQVPGGIGANHFLQRTLGELRTMDPVIDTKVNDWSIAVSYMRDLGVRPEGLRFVEVGTGWMPVMPICFSLAGASHCLTVDASRHLNPNLTFKMLEKLEKRVEKIAEITGRSSEKIQSDLKKLRQTRSIAELFEQARITYLAPGDAKQLPIANASVDIVFSNAVFEHISESELKAITKESERVLVPGGLGVHQVNCGDHYAYFDRGISEINYLQFSEEQWNRWNNSILYQNRLRAKEFLEVSRNSGLEVVFHSAKPNKKCLALLPQLKRAPEFDKYTAEELACTSLGFVGKKKAA